MIEGQRGSRGAKSQVDVTKQGRSEAAAGRMPRIGLDSVYISMAPQSAERRAVWAVLHSATPQVVQMQRPWCKDAASCWQGRKRRSKVVRRAGREAESRREEEEEEEEEEEVVVEEEACLNASQAFFC